MCKGNFQIKGAYIHIYYYCVYIYVLLYWDLVVVGIQP